MGVSDRKSAAAASSDINKSSQQDVEKGGKNIDQRHASAERASSNEQPSASSPKENASILETLCIAEGGLEDAVKRASRKIDSDSSKTRLLPFNVHMLMIKFCLKCQVRLRSDENRCLRGMRVSDELLEISLSSGTPLSSETEK